VNGSNVSKPVDIARYFSAQKLQACPPTTTKSIPVFDSFRSTSKNSSSRTGASLLTAKPGAVSLLAETLTEARKQPAWLFSATSTKRHACQQAFGP
jgi:hypothetical protein